MNNSNNSDNISKNTDNDLNISDLNLGLDGQYLEEKVLDSKNNQCNYIFGDSSQDGSKKGTHADNSKSNDKKNLAGSYTYTKQSKQQKQLILASSLFLLGQDGAKKTYWTILTASVRGKVLKIGITAQKNKYGTTLSILRKHAKNLSEYLNHGRFLNFYPKIVFFINKEAEEINELYSLLDSIEAAAMEN